MSTQPPSTDPPSAPPTETARGCHVCGGDTRTAWKRDGRGVLREHIVCCECPAVLGVVPDRKPQSAIGLFVGWYRPNKRAPWEALTTGATEDEALDRLLDAAPGGDKVVLVQGKRPDERPIRRRCF